MRCYAHHESDAVGVCHGCGRGVCRSCAREAPSGEIACGETCAASLHASRTMVANAMRSQDSHRTTAWLFPALLCGMGLLFLAGGLYRGRQPFATGAGALFVAFGAIYAWRIRAWAQRQVSP